MTDFLIDLPYHKRWYLPDHRHVVNSVIFADTMRCSILDYGTYLHRESHVMYIDVMKPGWEDLWIGYQEKARKAFPAPLRHKSRV